MTERTIIHRFWERTRTHPGKVALRYRSGGAWKDVTWAQYGDKVRSVGRALLAHGFQHSDRMGLLSGNRPEWFYADVACMSLGGCTAPIYGTNSPEQVAYILGHSESKIAVVEDRDQLDKVLKMRSELPHLQKVVVMTSYEGDVEGDFVVGWDDFLAAGKEIDDARHDEALSKVTPEDLATFVYTSGTTGPPKAVMLTHANIWWTADATERHIPMGEIDDARLLSYLPLSHIAERMVSHLLQIYHGTQTWFAGSVDTLLDDLKECRPTTFFGVPRVWEKFYAGITGKMAAADPNDRKVKLAKKAIEVGKRVGELEQEAVARGGKMSDARVPLSLKLQHAALD
ncbi:MAG: AMP-dependent synthetase/ligase, partial [Actinomycetota bacterium]